MAKLINEAVKTAISYQQYLFTTKYFNSDLSHPVTSIESLSGWQNFAVSGNLTNFFIIITLQKG